MFFVLMSAGFLTAGKYALWIEDRRRTGGKSSGGGRRRPRRVRSDRAAAPTTTKKLRGNMYARAKKRIPTKGRKSLPVQGMAADLGKGIPRPSQRFAGASSIMQVLCRKSKGNAELHCCVCGQGFVMFWERQTVQERAASRHEIQESLRRQHLFSAGREAHPQASCLLPEMVPEWNGSMTVAPDGQAASWKF